MSDTNSSQAVGNVLNDAKSAGDAVRQAGQQAKQAGADAVGHAMDVANEVKERAGSMASAVGEKASSMAQAGQGGLADKLDDIAKAVHRSGEQLEGHQDFVAHLVERGAAELSVLAKTLRSNDLQSILGDLGSLARRQPALFIGASMAAGFAMTRVGRVAASAPTPVSTPAVAPVSAGNTANAQPTVSATTIDSAPEVTSER